MNARERLYARLRGEPADKVPNLNIVMLFAARYADIPYGKFCSDYRYLVEAQVKTAVDFGLDIMSTMSDPYRETFDYGADVVFQEDYLPLNRTPLVTDVSELGKIRRWDPLASVRMLDRIKAVGLFRSEVGNEYPVLGWIEGPWAEFTDLSTVSDAMLMAYDEPEAVQEAMDLIAQQAIDCAIAQVRAGADVIGMGDAAASLMSPAFYDEFLFGLHQKIIEAVHREGAITKLHICGDINGILPRMVDTGSDIVDIDYPVDFNRAISLSEGKCSICGHFNPTSVLLQGSVRDVESWVEYSLKNGNGRNLISAGCEVPKMTPCENLMAVDNYLKRQPAK
jgi:uroporphyrinogen decarboxylase